MIVNGRKILRCGGHHLSAEESPAEDGEVTIFRRLDASNGLSLRSAYRISNNVGSVKSFLDRLLHPLRRVFSFVIFLWPSVDDHGSPVIFRSVSVRPTHLFDPISDHDYSFKLPLARERDAHSSGRRSTSRPVRFRAVPRAN